MSDFLLELRCEEIPARMQAAARTELARLFRREMEAAGITVAEPAVYSGPRRLALIAHDLPDRTEAVRDEAKGPPEGAPDAALDGFCRKNGVTRDRLELREVKGRATWFAVIERPGRETRDVLGAAIPAIIRDFSWPKSMRWGAASISTESIRWVRPLSGIVALLGEEIVPCAVGDMVAGATTVGHRFHHPGPITIGGAHDYVEKLRACQVIVDHEERALLIREGARAVAAQAGLRLVEDDGLVTENAGLTEWPTPLLGFFDETFLDVPAEVIQLTARVNQKYFVCEDAGGKLANAFICTANIEAADGGAAIVDGNRRVLAARLADARFFWEQDRRKTLAQHAEGLARITFHEKLGTLADKVERVARLAEWLASEGIVPGCDPALARQAAELCKADLVTEMVGEFPELQGVMGGYYARAEGLPDVVADAIRDHYKPVGQGDEVPTAPVTVAVSLADKLDNIASFFSIRVLPTGSKDPFALRRAALGIGQIIITNNLRVSIVDTFADHLGISSSDAQEMLEAGLMQAAQPNLLRVIDGIRNMSNAAKDVGPVVLKNMIAFEEAFKKLSDQLRSSLKATTDGLTFLADRLKVQQREAGVRHDLIDAVFALGNEDDLVRLLARVNALQSYIETPDGQNLLAAYKRAANILKKEDWSEPSGKGEALNTQGIARTGEEDPLALVDDPDLGPALRAAARERRENRLSYTPEPDEDALIDALDAAEPKAEAAVAAEDFEGAMQALASLRAPIDRFFDNVTVNDPDQDKRAARLDLLARFRDAVAKVADFSRIEG